MKHGGDIKSYEDKYDGEIIDFSSNINPLGYPKIMDEIISNGLSEIDKYPDIKYRDLTQSVCDYLKCNEENVVLGNGSMEIIDYSMGFKDNVFIYVPSFGEYEDRAIINNKKLKKLNFDYDFTIDINVLEKSLLNDSLLILGNPNNPTGLRIEKEKLLKIYNIVRKKNSVLILDEAFFEFSPRDYDSIDLFKEFNFENVLIIRAATKVFGMPGIRLGYGCCSKSMAKNMKNRQLPWSINTFANLAGNYIFKEEKYLRESIEYVKNEREFLIKELNKIIGLKAFNSHSNFILLKVEKFSGNYLLKRLVSKGILIRTCTSFEGLDDSYIRVAVKTREDNLKLINELKLIFNS